VENETLWIVDWDIPNKPASERMRFYRALRELCKRAGAGNWDRSTMSVLKTSSRELAEEVFSLVAGMERGRVNLYRAKLLKEHPTR